MRKTQLVFFSAKDERGVNDIQQWILQKALLIHESEIIVTERGICLSSRSNIWFFIIWHTIYLFLETLNI